MQSVNPSLLRVETAIAHARRGAAVCVGNGVERWQMIPVEYAKDTPEIVHLAVTSQRAQSLFPAENYDAPLLMKLSGKSASLQAIAGEIGEGNVNVSGIQPATISPAPEVISAGLQLLKWAGLLPAMVVAAPQADAVEVFTTDINSYADGLLQTLQHVVTAPVQLYAAGEVKVSLYRSGGQEHVAITVGDITGQSIPLLRVHSSCFTGDLLGSLRCDCGEQLHATMQMMRAGGCGVILYLMQEGRGIGLANKLRAYVLQHQGLDTVQANNALGFGDDERLFGLAGAILRHMNVCSVRLVTNNPRKLAVLKEFGIAVTERVPLVMPAHEHTKDYLATKFSKLGHLS